VVLIRRRSELKPSVSSKVSSLGCLLIMNTNPGGLCKWDPLDNVNMSFFKIVHSFFSSLIDRVIFSCYIFIRIIVFYFIDGFTGFCTSTSNDLFPLFIEKGFMGTCIFFLFEQGCILFRIPMLGVGGIFSSHLGRFSSCRGGKGGKEEEKGEKGRKKEEKG